jgi:hypothetical protein
MPVPNFKTYCAILDRTHAGRFAFPAVDFTSLTTANAALEERVKQAASVLRASEKTILVS